LQFCTKQKEYVVFPSLSCHFKEVYSALYNSASTADEVNSIKERLNELITASSMQEVMKITGEKVKKAAGLLKLGNADVSEGFCSDAILNGPDILCEQLACVYRSWCVHGTVTPTLLAYPSSPC
jgi:hypothetical protein